MSTQPFRAIRHAGSPSTGGSAFSLESHINSSNAHPGYVKKGDQVGSVNLTAHETDKGAHAQYYLRRLEMALEKSDYASSYGLDVNRYSGDAPTTLTAYDKTVVTTRCLYDLANNWPEYFMSTTMPYWHIVNKEPVEGDDITLSGTDIPSYLSNPVDSNETKILSYEVNDTTGAKFVPSWTLFRSLWLKVLSHEFTGDRYSENPLASIFSKLGHTHDDRYAFKRHTHSFEDVLDANGNIPASADHNHDDIYIRKDDPADMLDFSPLGEVGIYKTSALETESGNYNLNEQTTQGNRAYYIKKGDTLLNFPADFVTALATRFTTTDDFTFDYNTNTNGQNPLILNVLHGQNEMFKFKTPFQAFTYKNASLSYAHNSLSQILICNAGVPAYTRLEISEDDGLANAVKSYKQKMQQIYWRTGYSLETAWYIDGVIEQLLGITPKDFYELASGVTNPVSRIADKVNAVLDNEFNQLLYNGNLTGDLIDTISVGLYKPMQDVPVTMDYQHFLLGSTTAKTINIPSDLRSANNKIQAHDLVDILIPFSRTGTAVSAPTATQYATMQLVEDHSNLLPYLHYYKPTVEYTALDSFDDPVVFSNTYAINNDDVYSDLTFTVNSAISGKINVSINSCSNCNIDSAYSSLYVIDDESYILHEYRPVLQDNIVYQSIYKYYKKSGETDDYGRPKMTLLTGWTAGDTIPVPKTTVEDDDGSHEEINLAGSFVYIRTAITIAGGGYRWNKRPVSCAKYNGGRYEGGEKYVEGRNYYVYTYGDGKFDFEPISFTPVTNNMGYSVVFSPSADDNNTSIEIFTDYDIYKAEHSYELKLVEGGENLIKKYPGDTATIDGTTNVLKNGSYFTTGVTFINGLSYVKYLETEGYVTATKKDLTDYNNSAVLDLTPSSSYRYILRKLDEDGNVIAGLDGLIFRDMTSEQIASFKTAIETNTQYMSTDVGSLQLSAIVADTEDHAYYYLGEPIPFGHNTSTNVNYAIYAVDGPKYINEDTGEEESLDNVYQLGFFYKTCDTSIIAGKKYFALSTTDADIAPIYTLIDTTASGASISDAYELVSVETFFDMWRALKELTTTGGYGTTNITNKIIYNFGNDGQLVTWDNWDRMITANDSFYKELAAMNIDNRLSTIEEQIIAGEVEALTTLNIYRIKFAEIYTKEDLALWTYRADGSTLTPPTSSKQYFTLNLKSTRVSNSTLDLSNITADNVNLEFEVSDKEGTITNTKRFVPVAKYSFKDDGEVIPVFKTPMFRIRFDDVDEESKLLDLVLPDKWFTEGAEGGEETFTHWVPIELPDVKGDKKISLYANIVKTSGVIGGSATYVVKFYAYGELISSTEVPFGFKVTFPDESSVTPQTGQHFGGWKDNGELIADTSKYIIVGDANIHAYFYVNFTFDAAGGVDVDTMKVTADTNGVLPSTTKKYYTLTNWKNVATNTTHAAGSEVLGDIDKSFEAVWTLANYTITIDGNGGVGTTSSISVTRDDISSIPGIHSRTNYDLLGYYTGKNGGTKVYDSNGYAAIASPYYTTWDMSTVTTLYANWYAHRTTVHMHDNNATVACAETVQDLVFIQDQPAPTMNVPEKYGYNLVEYAATGSTMTAVKSSDGLSIVYPGSDTVKWNFTRSDDEERFYDVANYYASWTAMSTEFIYVCKNFQLVDGAPAAATTLMGLVYDSPMPTDDISEDFFPPSTKDGYTFDGYGEIYDPKSSYDENPSLAVLITKYINADGTSAHVWDREPDDKINLYPIWIKDSDDSLEYYIDIYMKDADNARDFVSTTHAGYERPGIVSAKVNRKDVISASIFDDVADPVCNGRTLIGYYRFNSATGTVGERIFNADKTLDDEMLTPTNKRWCDLTPLVTELVAQWRANIYTLVLLSDAEDETSAILRTNCTYGTTIPSVNLTGYTLPTSTGNRFDGWSEDTLGKVYDSTGASTGLDLTVYPTTAGVSDIFLKPIFIPTITLTMVTDRACTWTKMSGATTTDTSYAASATVATNTVDADALNLGLQVLLTATGYTHTGWKITTRDGVSYPIETTYSPSVVIPNSDDFEGTHSYVLNPVWTANKYTITLSYNGNTETLEATYDQKVPDSVKFKAGGTYGVPSQTGYDFTGWYYNNTQMLTSAGAGVGTFTLTDDVTLTASGKFTAHTIKVKLDPNYTGCPEATYVNVTYGESTDDCSAPADRDGYTFLGWYDAADGGTKYVNAVGTSAKIWDKDPEEVDGVRSATLYAHWEEIIKYTTSFNGNAPSGATVTNVPESVQCVAGESITLPAAPTYSRTNYTGTFLGWYDAASGGNKVGGYNETYTPTKTITLYAQWSQTYTGGSSDPVTPTYIYIYYTKPSNATITSRFTSDTLTSTYVKGTSPIGIVCTPNTGYKVASYTADGVKTTCSGGDGDAVTVNTSSTISSITFEVVSAGSSSGGTLSTVTYTVTASSPLTLSAGSGTTKSGNTFSVTSSSDPVTFNIVVTNNSDLGYECSGCGKTFTIDAYSTYNLSFGIYKSASGGSSSIGVTGCS